MKLCFIFLLSYAMFAKGDIEKSLHDGNTQFTTRMFSEVAKKNPEKSFVLSAFSVITPLSQLAAASEGPSHDELLNAVGFSDDNTTNEVFALIDLKFNSVKGIQLKKASKLYIPLGYEVHDTFAAVSKNVYHSEIANVDFLNNEKTAKEINTWVEDQTNKRIKDLVDPSSINSDTRAVLVNAIYFKGSWKYPFNDYATESKNFHVTKQKTLQLPTMHSTQDYSYKESQTLDSKILELPYDGDESSFLIVLPNKLDGIEKLIKQLKDPYILDAETKDLFTSEVRVSIPKFKIETTTDLKEILLEMNVTKMFSNEANITKLLNSQEQLFISSAVQKAFIEINEEGAEAAAANAFLISATSYIPRQIYEFTADHPFVFFLKVHNEIIFNGVFYGS